MVRKIKNVFSELKWFEALDWFFFTLLSVLWAFIVSLVIFLIPLGTPWPIFVLLVPFALLIPVGIVHASKYAISCNKYIRDYSDE